MDHGYDVADSLDIEPTYGDLATFDRLVAAAGERDIKVMLDLVPNHCSSQHAWFQAAVRAGTGYDGRFDVELRGDGPHLIVVDHGIVEVFADGGAAVLTAQVFAGPAPEVTVV